MSLLKAIKAQLGLSNTPANNFTITAEADNGTLKLARGNAGATTQDILTVDASGNVNAPVAMQQGGVAMPRMVLATAQNSTSGTAIDFTSIPSWAKRITVMFNGVSTNGVSPWIIQLGTAPSTFVTAGYSGSASSTTNTTFSSNGFSLTVAAVAAGLYSGTACINNISGNNWVLSSILSQASTNSAIFGATSVSAGAVIDRIRITTVNGTDTFDAGSINIMYEG